MNPGDDVMVVEGERSMGTTTAGGAGSDIDDAGAIDDDGPRRDQSVRQDQIRARQDNHGVAIMRFQIGDSRLEVSTAILLET